MNTIMLATYFIAFALLMGSAFAMMYANITSITEEMNKPKPRHPEAPEPGEKVMYVDVSQDTNREFQHRKQWLEDLYTK